MDAKEIIFKQIVVSERNHAIDPNKLAELLSKHFKMVSEKTKPRLSSLQKQRLVKRYREIPKTGETVADIAKDFNIVEWTVRRVARQADVVPVRIVKRVLKLKEDPFLNSQDIANEVGLDLVVVNKIISRYGVRLN